MFKELLVLLFFFHLQVFGTSPTCDMNEKFWDILAFCHQVSLLMVSEIRKRASNQSTEAASCAIAKFLEIENCEESSNGWMLLSTLNLLAAGDSTLVQVRIRVFDCENSSKTINSLPPFVSDTHTILTFSLQI